MSFILTLVSSSPNRPVGERHIALIHDVLAHYEIRQTCAPVWLAENKAVDLPISEFPCNAMMLLLQAELAPSKADIFVVTLKNRRKKLLLADMDSTIIQGESLDELSKFKNLEKEVAAITQRAMDGLMDYETALKARIALLRDLPQETLDQVSQSLQLNAGAKALVQTMKKNNAFCALVSGGLAVFTETISQRTGFDAHHGNEIEISKNRLTGQVIDPVLTQNGKLKLLNHYKQQRQLDITECLAIGDGANDLSMLKEAGLGIGFQPKRPVKDALDNHILYGDLTAALYAQGYRKNEIFTENQ